MIKTFRCAALAIMLAILPAATHADTIGYSFNVWESVCRPSDDVSQADAADCFVEAIRFYEQEFAQLVYRHGAELHCHDDMELFWSELDATRERLKGYILPPDRDWRFVVSQLIFYSGDICPDISL